MNCIYYTYVCSPVCNSHTLSTCYSRPVIYCFVMMTVLTNKYCGDHDDDVMMNRQEREKRLSKTILNYILTF